MKNANQHIRNNFYTVISDVKYPLSDDNSTIDSYEVGITQITDYSPFGVELDDRTIQNSKYRYSFQNQEHHDEIKGKGNYLNYKYRGYDPRIGRLDWTLDPLKDSYPWNSPYAFSENVVINAVELEGLEKEVVIDNSNSPSKDKPVKINVGAKGAYDVLNDVYFGPVLKQMNSEGLINSYSTVTFTWTGQRIETKNTGPWYWKSTTTDLYYQYDIGFNYLDVDVSVPIEIGVGVSTYHSGSNPVDYGFALIGSGLFSQVFKQSLRPLYNQAAQNIKSTALGLIKSGKYTTKDAAIFANNTRNNLKIQFLKNTPKDLRELIFKYNKSRGLNKFGTKSYEELSKMKSDMQIIESAANPQPSLKAVGESIYKVLGKEAEPVLKKYKIMPK